MNCGDCIGLTDLLRAEQVRVNQPRPAAKLRFVVQVCGEIPEWVQAGVDSGEFTIQQVKQFEPQPGDTVLFRTWHGEEILGQLTMTWATTGLDRVRVVSKQRVFNLRANQIVAVIRDTE